MAESVEIVVVKSDFDEIRLYDRPAFFYANYKEGQILDIGNIGGVFGKGKLSKFHSQVKESIDGASVLFGFDLFPPEHPEKFENQQTGDIEKGLPYEDGFFDTIYMGQVLEHIRNPGIVLREIKRVLKDDGVFVLDVPNPYSLFRILKYFFKRKESLGDITHLIFWTPASLKAILRDSGFVINVLSTKLSLKFKYFPFFIVRGLGAHICVSAKKL